MSKYLLLLLLLTASFLMVYYLFLKAPPPLPHFDLEAHWGEGLPTNDTTIRPYKVKFSEEMVEDLKHRLKRHRPPQPPLEGVAFEYGFNSDALPNWVQYWERQYDFKRRERFFNKFPHYKTNVQGLDIHFIRVTPKPSTGKEVVPMLLLHGWPGSVREFYEAIPLLTAESEDRDFVLELIIPSLPGYGFSSAPVRPGLSAAEMAVVMRNLMRRLGFSKYYIQGGDWGAIITSNLATIFPDEVLGYHTNLVSTITTRVLLLTLLGSLYPPLVVDRKLEDRMYPLSEHYGFLIEESGYLHIQSTKPDTLGISMTDSPTGLLAYILEKFSTATDKDFREKKDGGLEIYFTKDQLLDNLMVYWSSGSITSSFRLYAESFNKRYFGMKMNQIPTPVPMWTLQAKNEIIFIPPWFIRSKFKNVIHSSYLEKGGHFLALQMPKEFSEDVVNSVTAFRAWHKRHVKTEL